MNKHQIKQLYRSISGTQHQYILALLIISLYMAMMHPTIAPYAIMTLLSYTAITMLIQAK